jgi:hypothetical protein
VGFKYIMVLQPQLKHTHTQMKVCVVQPHSCVVQFDSCPPLLPSLTLNQVTDHVGVTCDCPAHTTRQPYDVALQESRADQLCNFAQRMARTHATCWS